MRYLARQALAFRGDNESISSSYRGNFIELVKSYGEINEEIEKVTLEEALRNAKYVAPKIQKEILNILPNRVRAKICEEVGHAKFCILMKHLMNLVGNKWLLF